MRAIPRNLLIHSAKAYSEQTDNTWNDKTGELVAELDRVRVEPSASLRLTNTNEQVQLSAVLFFDCRNSAPKDFDFSKTDIITALGNEYRVINVDKLYDERGLHHYEVGLCL